MLREFLKWHCFGHDILLLGKILPEDSDLKKEPMPLTTTATLPQSDQNYGQFCSNLDFIHIFFSPSGIVSPCWWATLSDSAEKPQFYQPQWIPHFVFLAQIYHHPALLFWSNLNPVVCPRWHVPHSWTLVKWQSLPNVSSAWTSLLLLDPLLWLYTQKLQTSGSCTLFLDL